MGKDVILSALAHGSALALLVLISEVHPFHTPPQQAVAVDLVTPEQFKEQLKSPEPEQPQKAPTREADQHSSPEQSAEEPGSPPPQAAPPQQDAGAVPKPAATPAPSPAAGYSPQPDISVKYGVMLGLPEPLSVQPKAPEKQEEGGDSAAAPVDLASNVIAEFRRHVRSCSKLPASVARSDHIVIKLRAMMTTDGRLARPPVLVEASASAKGPLLMQSAIDALVACQPYTMLPAEKYREWRVLDLTFTPQDFDAS